MRYTLRQSDGFGLIEVLILIIVVGILASIALQSMTAVVEDARVVKTEREMEMLARAIVGDPDLTQNGQRCDFGYVGDVGAFPPNLQALLQNPGGYSTWDGPYLPPTFSQDSTGFRIDEWGTAYVYAAGITVNSTGSGSSITKKIASATTDYLLNSINGTITDINGDPPGLKYADSVSVVVTIPDGSGSTLTKSYLPNVAGSFTMDSLPVGRHPLRLIFEPNVDTLFRYLTILPRHKSSRRYQFAAAYFSSSTGPAVSGDTISLSTDGNATLGGLTFPDDDIAQYDPVTDVATTLLDGSTVFSGSENIDACHLLADGHVLLSTTQTASIGGLTFADEDIVDYDPVAGTATMVFDGSSVFSANEDIDAVFLQDDDDLVEYDLISLTASLFLDGASVFGGSSDINAVHMNTDGDVFLSVDNATSSIGSLNFSRDDLVQYDTGAGTATMYFDGSDNFSSVPINIDAVHIGPPSGAISTGSVYTLRPDGDGPITNLATSGCSQNYQCVDEIATDDDATRVTRAANSFATDIYTFEDPPGTSGTIARVTIYCRARRARNQGEVRPTVYVGSTEFNGTAQTLTQTYADYSQDWTTNPSSGTDWTWADITTLQAGVSLRGQNFNFPAYCTQVWVEVTYVP